jgi:hypothetical protein
MYMRFATAALAVLAVVGATGSGSAAATIRTQDDRVYIFKHVAAKWVADAPFVILNHNSNGAKPQPTYDGGIFKGAPVGQLLGWFLAKKPTTGMQGDCNIPVSRAFGR